MAAQPQGGPNLLQLVAGAPPLLVTGAWPLLPVVATPLQEGAVMFLLGAGAPLLLGAQHLWALWAVGTAVLAGSAACALGRTR